MGPTRGGDRHPSHAQPSFLGCCRSREQLCPENLGSECPNLPCPPFLCPPNSSAALHEAPVHGLDPVHGKQDPGMSEEIRAERSCCGSLSHLLRPPAEPGPGYFGAAWETLVTLPCKLLCADSALQQGIKSRDSSRAGAGIFLWASCLGFHGYKSPALLCLQTGQIFFSFLFFLRLESIPW